MAKTFVTGFIPVILFLFGTIFYTTITVWFLMVVGLLFASYFIGAAIRKEFGDFNNGNQ